MTTVANGVVADLGPALVGHAVRFVMKSGAVRPLFILNDSEVLVVDGIVLLDKGDMEGPDAPTEGHEALDGSGVKTGLLRVSSVAYDPAGAPGTWHWTHTFQRVQESAAVTAGHVEAMFAKWRDNVTAKLEAHMEAVQKIAENLSEEFAEHVQTLGSDVAKEAGKVLDAMKFSGSPKPIPAGIEAIGRLGESAAEIHSRQSQSDAAEVSAADLDAVAAEQQAANATANDAHDAAEAVQQPGANVGSGG